VIMTNTWISVSISVMGFLVSVTASAFISGQRWGMVTKDIEYMRRDIAVLMAYFRLTPNDQHGKR
jgi:hypothetical protein